MNDLKHGTGTLIMENGETYEGKWASGLMHGFGRYTFSNGDVYTGCFDKNKPNGHGKREYHYSGNIYEGQWKDGKAIG